MDETIAFDDILTERCASRCLLCQQRLTVVHLHIRPIGAPACWRRPCVAAASGRTPSCTRLDALLHARYAPQRWARPGCSL